MGTLVLQSLCWWCCCIAACLLPFVSSSSSLLMSLAPTYLAFSFREQQFWPLLPTSASQFSIVTLSEISDGLWWQYKYWTKCWEHVVADWNHDVEQLLLREKCSQCWIIFKILYELLSFTVDPIIVQIQMNYHIQWLQAKWYLMQLCLIFKAHNPVKAASNYTGNEIPCFSLKEDRQERLGKGYNYYYYYIMGGAGRFHCSQKCSSAVQISCHRTIV